MKQLSMFEVRDDSSWNDEPTSPFESIKHVDANGEYWLARELQRPLGYTEWRKFQQAVNRAKTSCRNSGHDSRDHFGGAAKMVSIGSSTKRKISDIRLTRYACYLIAMNGDPRKREISDAQTYFAVQTRRQELADIARIEGIEDRKEFTASAKRSHITHTPDYAGLTNATYKELFGAAKVELVSQLRLDKRQARQFRNHVSILALRAIQAAEAASAAQFGGLSGMNTIEQIDTVQTYARIFAPAFHEAANTAGIDLLSGKRMIEE